MVLHDHTQTRKILIFFNYVKAFPVLSMYEGLSYVTVHHCICRNSFYWPYRCPIYIQFGQSSCRNGLGVSLGRPESPLRVLLSAPRQSSHVSQLACAQQQLPGGNLLGCSRSRPGEQLSKLVKRFVVKPEGDHPSTLSHISPLNQTSPMSLWCRDWLGSSWPPRGNEWLSTLGVHTGKSLLSQL